MSEGVLVSGTTRVTLTGECARCLDPLTSELEVEIQQLYVYPGNEIDADDEDDDIGLLIDDYVDLEPVLRDAVVLALPLAPVCKDDCLGLVSRVWGSARGRRTVTIGTRRSTRDGPPCEHCTMIIGSRRQPTHRRRPGELAVPVPKRRMSRSNTRSRRAQWKTAAPTLVRCNNPACRAAEVAARRVPELRHLQPAHGRLTT